MRKDEEEEEADEMRQKSDGVSRGRGGEMSREMIKMIGSEVHWNGLQLDT